MTRDEFQALLVSRGYDETAAELINRWLARGDGAAVYENHDLGHPDLGHVQITSYGSSAAQLETDEPPSRLPDIGSAINWRYTLIGTYRGEAISLPKLPDEPPLAPVKDMADATRRGNAWALAGHQSHEFAGEPGEPYCRVCAGGHDGIQHERR